jgi:hypothetical protein
MGCLRKLGRRPVDPEKTGETLFMFLRSEFSRYLSHLFMVAFSINSILYKCSHSGLFPTISYADGFFPGLRRCPSGIGIKRTVA